MKNLLYIVMLLLCSLGFVACEESNTGIEPNNGIEFIFKTAVSNYHAVVDTTNKTISASGINSSKEIKSVAYQLPEGYTISPEPTEVDVWYKEQIFEITSNKGVSEKYTLLLPDIKEVVDNEFVVMGYIMIDRVDFATIFETIDFSKVTHTIVSFANIKSDATIITTSIDKNVDLVVDAAHQAGGKALLAINKAEEGEFTEAISTEEKRTNLIETLVEYAQARGFDGIDIDYEEYNTFNLEDLIAFAAQLRESMPQEWLLTCAVAPWLEYDGYAQYFDYINVMSYDDKVTGDTPGAHASMDKFKSDMANTQKWAISDAQIVGGVPFYGWSWEDPSSVLGISYDYVISRFPTAEVADADNYGSLYYNGRNTIREKCVYVKEYGYGGIMIWQMAQDCLNPDFRLLDVIDQEMRNE